MGGIIPSNDESSPEDAELAKEEQERRDRAKKLEQLRIQSLRRRRGSSIGQDSQQDQQGDTIG